MSWLIALLAGLGLVAAAPSAPATPALPSQCPGVISDYNVIYQPNIVGNFTGTAGKDLIIVKGGQIWGEGGNDCIKVSKTSVVFGGAGDDVIIGVGGQAYGDYQTSPYQTWVWVPEDCDADFDDPCDQIITTYPEGIDRCIGGWAVRVGCEATN